MRPPQPHLYHRLMRATLLLVAALAVGLAPATSWASDDEEEDESAPMEPAMEGARECYSGLNVAFGFSINPGQGFAPGGGGRAGCRMLDYFGLELEIDGLDDLAGQQRDRILMVGGNALVFLPLQKLSPVFDRFQIFGFGGLDYGYSRFSGNPAGDTDGTVVWSVGTGTRIYLTENFAFDGRSKYVNYTGSTRLTFWQLDVGFTFDFYAY